MLGFNIFINSGDLVLLLIRLILGSIMVFYGSNKVSDLKSNAEDFNDMGFKPGFLWGIIVAFVEFFGGIFLIFGILPELFAALFGFQMLMGTFWKIKIEKPFTDWSYDIQLLALSAVIIVFGSGYLTLIPLFL